MNVFGKGTTLRMIENLAKEQKLQDLERRIEELEVKLNTLYDYITKSKLRESEDK